MAFTAPTVLLVLCCVGPFTVYVDGLMLPVACTARLASLRRQPSIPTQLPLCVLSLSSTPTHPLPSNDLGPAENIAENLNNFLRKNFCKFLSRALEVTERWKDTGGICKRKSARCPHVKVLRLE